VENPDIVLSIDLDEADVYLCGFGLKFPHDLTLETVAILRSVKTIFCLPMVDLAGIAPNAEIVDLTDCYGASLDRALSYQLMADRVLSCAFAGTVAFVTYGHPSVGTTATRLILDGAKRSGLTTCVTNAPSSIEAVCSQLRIDPFDGVEIWDATAYLLHRRSISADATLLLMQVPYVGSRQATHISDGQRFSADALTALRDHLTNTYGSDHTVHFVRMPVLGYNLSIVTTTTALLDQHVPANAATLVVPRARRSG